jgi:hypothetical protein
VPPIAVLGEEVALSVVLVSEGPGITRETYQEVIRRFTGGKARMESPADWPVEGLLAHIAGEGPNGFRVVDVWESEDAARRFGDVLMPILAELGVTQPPEIYPPDAFVSA